MFGLLFAGAFLWPVFIFELAVVGFLLADYNLSKHDNTGFYGIAAISALMYTAFSWYYGWPAPSIPKVLTYAALYVFAGVMWSFVKWFFVSRGETAVNQQKENWKDYSIKYPTLTKDEFLNSSYNNLNPKRGEARFRIHQWIVYWPLSIIGTFFGDIILRGIENIQKSLSKIYVLISGGTKNLD